MFDRSGKIRGGGARGEVAVGIMTRRQLNQGRPYAGALQALRELAGSLLAGLVFILVKDDVDRTVR